MGKLVVKVKFPLEQSMKIHERGENLTIYFNFGDWRGWCSTPRHGWFPRRKTDGTHCGGCWVFSQLFVTDAEKLFLTKFPSKERSNLKTVWNSPANTKRKILMTKRIIWWN